PKANDYAQDTARMLKAGGIRVETDLRDEKMGAKIRDAELMKIPYMLVVGPREAEAGTVSPRRKGVGQLEALTRQAFLERVQQEVRERPEGSVSRAGAGPPAARDDSFRYEESSPADHPAP